MSLLALSFLSCIAIVKAAGECPATCYKATCDYWDGGYWGNCETLQRTYGCSCAGCVCDGCPDSSCDSPKFDPKRCPNAGNAMCDEDQNVAECAWDGGDCCDSTCIGTLCGPNYNCKDPAADKSKSSDHRENTQLQEARASIVLEVTSTSIPTATNPAEGDDEEDEARATGMMHDEAKGEDERLNAKIYQAVTTQTPDTSLMPDMLAEVSFCTHLQTANLAMFVLAAIAALL